MKIRYNKLDYIRGIALINMIIYHALWDMKYIFNYDLFWFDTTVTYIWQQLICYTFILLSGFCFLLSKNNFVRGLKVFTLGLVVTVVTLFVLPDSPIIFGVLTLIGSSMILLSLFDNILNKLNPYLGTFIFLFLFFIFRNVNSGYLGFEFIKFCRVPNTLYRDLISSYFGFPSIGFVSSDYFSLIPWLFLYIVGYYLFKIIRMKDLLIKLIPSINFPIEFIGKNSLIVYAVHQPIVYLLLLIFA